MKTINKQCPNCWGFQEYDDTYLAINNSNECELNNNN